MKKLIIALFAIGTLASAQAQDFSRGNPYQDRPRIQHLLNKAEFERLQETVKKTPFADDKKTAFRAVMRGSYLTVDQLRLLLKQFVFNDDKLDWAMMAYPYTADQKEYYRLREDFTFITTQNKFDEFVADMADTGRGYRSRHAMGRDEFAQLQNMIKKELFSDGKQSVFKVALKDRFITVAQVTELVRQQTFDDDKLAWAFLAYNYTSDTRNYYQLRNLFTFDSNKQKLDKFLLEQAD